MSTANQLPDPMTVAEFLAWTPPDAIDRWELIDGTPRAMAPATPRHGAIQNEIGRLIGNDPDPRQLCAAWFKHIASAHGVMFAPPLRVRRGWRPSHAQRGQSGRPHEARTLHRRDD
jgi:Putative restriction endonuclease